MTTASVVELDDATARVAPLPPVCFSQARHLLGGLLPRTVADVRGARCQVTQVATSLWMNCGGTIVEYTSWWQYV